MNPEEEEEVQDGFTAKLSNAKVLQQIFKAINFKDDATVFLSHKGIKVTVEESKSFQGNAFVQREIFQDIQIEVPKDNIDEDDDYVDLSFNVSLSTLLECLNLFGLSSASASSSAISTLGGFSRTASTASTAISSMSASTNANLVLHYGAFGGPFNLWLEEAGCVSKAAVPTRDPEDTVIFNFSREDIAAKIILSAENLKEIFHELDSTSDVLEFAFSDADQKLTIGTFGVAAEVKVSIPSDSDIVHIFECTKSTSAKYKFAMLKHALRPIGMSEKVSIRMDDRDFLCLQYKIQYHDVTCFVEFYCAPEEDCDYED